MKSIVFATTAAVLAGGSAMAAPYVESKTNTALSGGTYEATQTELRIGYETSVGTGVNVYGEIGPGYEWNNVTSVRNEYVTVGEIGVSAPLAQKVALKAKVTGELGGVTNVFDLGGELKVRYSF